MKEFRRDLGPEFRGRDESSQTMTIPEPVLGA